jgi:hypothetical protein
MSGGILPDIGHFRGMPFHGNHLGQRIVKSSHTRFGGPVLLALHRNLLQIGLVNEFTELGGMEFFQEIMNPLASLGLAVGTPHMTIV